MRQPVHSERVGCSTPGPGSDCSVSWRRNDQPDQRLCDEEHFRPLTCGFGAPGRTRTCNLRIRSKTRPVRLVRSRSIAAGQAGSVVWPVRFWPRLLQRPDCQRDCRHHRLPVGSLQVVADYKRVSAVPRRRSCSRGRASGPQHLGIEHWRQLRLSISKATASPVNSSLPIEIAHMS